MWIFTEDLSEELLSGRVWDVEAMKWVTAVVTGLNLALLWHGTEDNLKEKYSNKYYKLFTLLMKKHINASSIFFFFFTVVVVAVLL